MSVSVDGTLDLHLLTQQSSVLSAIQMKWKTLESQILCLCVFDVALTSVISWLLFNIWVHFNIQLKDFVCKSCVSGGGVVLIASALAATSLINPVGVSPALAAAALFGLWSLYILYHFLSSLNPTYLQELGLLLLGETCWDRTCA